MKRILLFIFAATLALYTFAQNVDMQAHVMSDEGKAAYTAYVAKQNA